jgi:hypothetical protein
MIHIKAFVVGLLVVAAPIAALGAIIANDLVGWLMALLGAGIIYCAGRAIIS